MTPFSVPEQTNSQSWRALPQSSTFRIPLRIWAPMLSLSSTQGDMIFFVCRKSSLFLFKRKAWVVLPSENCSKKLLSLPFHFPIAPQLNFTWISFIVLDGLARNYYWKGINCMSCLEICFVFVAVLILACLWEDSWSLLLSLTSKRSVVCQLLQHFIWPGEQNGTWQTIGSTWLSY